MNPFFRSLRLPRAFITPRLVPSKVLLKASFVHIYCWLTSLHPYSMATRGRKRTFAPDGSPPHGAALQSSPLGERLLKLFAMGIIMDTELGYHLWCCCYSVMLTQECIMFSAQAIRKLRDQCFRRLPRQQNRVGLRGRTSNIWLHLAPEAFTSRTFPRRSLTHIARTLT